MTPTPENEPIHDIRSAIDAVMQESFDGTIDDIEQHPDFREAVIDRTVIAVFQRVVLAVKEDPAIELAVEGKRRVLNRFKGGPILDMDDEIDEYLGEVYELVDSMSPAERERLRQAPDQELPLTRGMFVNRDILRLRGGIRSTTELAALEDGLDEALDTVWSLTPEPLPNPVDAARLQIFGRVVIDKVFEALPEELKGMSVKLGRALSRSRDGIAERTLEDIYEFLKPSHARDSIQARQVNELGQPLYDMNTISLDSIRAWPNADLNCLAISMMLTAVAEAAGADFLFTNRLQSAHDGTRPADVEVYGRARDWLDENGVTYSTELDAMFEHLLAESSMKAEDFHHAISIKMVRSWRMLDPYQHTYATPDDTWDMDGYYEKGIKRDAELFPGIVVYGESAVSSEFQLERAKQMVDTALLVSGTLLERLTTGGIETFNDLEIALEDASKEVALRIKGLTEEQLDLASINDHEFVDIIQSPKFWIEFLHKAYEDELTADELVQLFDRDKSARERFIDDIIKVPLLVAIGDQMNMYNLMAKNEHHSVDNAVEFARPETMLALLLINHLIAWADHDTNELGAQLVEHTSSQVIWHEAMQAGIAPTRAMRAQEELLRQRPTGTLHDRVRWQLLVRGENFDNSIPSANS